MVECTLRPSWSAKSMLVILLMVAVSLICTRSVTSSGVLPAGTPSATQDHLPSAQASSTASSSAAAAADRTTDDHQIDEFDLFMDDDGGDPLLPHLPTSKLVIQDIIQRHDTYDTSTCNQSAFEGNSLAYVTPWNNHGYDVVKIFRGKFTHVSPVWYTLRGLGDHFRLDGGHDVDEGWMEEVRKPLDNGFSAKIMPRILFAEWQEQDYAQLVQNPKVEAMVLEKLVDEVLRYEFDGIVLEIASPSLFTRFITRLAGALRREMRDLILVIQPPRPSDPKGMPVFSREHFNLLREVLAGFSLMTYDFSIQTPGPNSPLKWIKESVERLDPDPESPYRAKIFTGLNFYGIDFTNSQRIPIIGKSFLSMLNDTKHHVEFGWDEDAAEHIFRYMEGGAGGESVITHFIFYPTLHSIRDRMSLLESLGTGLSIWEVGQGLEYFYDLI